MDVFVAGDTFLRQPQIGETTGLTRSAAARRARSAAARRGGKLGQYEWLSTCPQRRCASGPQRRCASGVARRAGETLVCPC